MTAAVLGAVGIACGVLLLVRTLHPKPVGIPTLIDALSGGTRSDVVESRAGYAGFKARTALRCAPWLEKSPFYTSNLRADLAITRSTPTDLTGETVVAAIGAAVAVPVGGVLVTLAGARIPVTVPAVAMVAAGMIGAAVPFLELRQKAARARQEFRRALAMFLELVALAMAGAMGVEGALDAVASLSGDRAFTEIRTTIGTARMRGEAPWRALGTLGEEIGVPELSELATNLVLAGSEGARVRSSLSSKASTLRRREMSEAEADANSTTEKMFVPGVLLLLGFMVFVGYPAVVHVFHTL